MNPDGAEFDMAGGSWHQWRKNRRPIREFDGDRRRSQPPVRLQVGRRRQLECQSGQRRYRGPNPWYAPEVRHYRDFISGRVVDGKQQIKVILSLHSAAKLVLWPYSYTKENVPPEMPQDDHDAFVALGTKLASLNGYTPEQGSDLYRVPGDQDDFAYHEWGIFTFTFEMKKGPFPAVLPDAIGAQYGHQQQPDGGPVSAGTG